MKSAQLFRVEGAFSPLLTEGLWPLYKDVLGRQRRRDEVLTWRQEESFGGCPGFFTRQAKRGEAKRREELGKLGAGDVSKVGGCVWWAYYTPRRSG
jgi:hypothetical protein